MAELHFEPKVDLSCAAALYHLARDRQLIEKKTEALDHVFYLGGTLNAWFAQDENHNPEVFGAVSVPNELEGEGALLDRVGEELNNVGALPEGQKETEETEGNPFKGAVGAKPAGKMNEVLAMLLKKLIEAILEQLL